jgi:hypothetical protein
MLTSTEFIIAWGAYLTGCILYFVAFWPLTRWMPSRLIRHAFRLGAMVALLTPCRVDPETVALAPAIFITLFDVTLRGEQFLSEAVLALCVSTAVALVILILDHIRYLYLRSRS